MTSEQSARLFAVDLNLSPEARTLIAHVGTKGKVELAYDRIGRMLHIRDERKIRRAVSEAEDSTWVAVNRQTGRGHAPLFTFTPPDSPAKKVGVKPDRVAENAPLNGDTPAENAPLKKEEFGKTEFTPAKNATLSDRGAKNATLNGSMGGGYMGGDAVADADTDNPLLISPLPISAQAEAAIQQHAEKFTGFRDAMRDYLRQRVPPENHYAVVQSVATWMGGFGFTWRGHAGVAIPPDHFPGLLAAAFNELAGTDEKLYRYPPGDIRNLKTKLGILCQDWGKNPRPINGADRRVTTPADEQEYETRPYLGLNS